MLEMKVTGTQVLAIEGEHPVGMLTFRQGDSGVTVESVDYGGDIWVADGLIRTALNWCDNHRIPHVDFAPAIDRELLHKLYGNAADNGIDDVSFFFQTCKHCGCGL